MHTKTTPRIYQGTPRLQPDGSFFCDSDTLTLTTYRVRLEEDRRWTCTCPSFGYDSLTCKHIIKTVQMQEVAQLRADEKPRVTEEPVKPRRWRPESATLIGMNEYDPPKPKDKPTLESLYEW